MKVDVEFNLSLYLSYGLCCASFIAQHGRLKLRYSDSTIYFVTFSIVIQEKLYDFPTALPLKKGQLQIIKAYFPSDLSHFLII